MIKNICKQILCYFFDGTEFVLTRFDKLLNDEGYQGVIETNNEQMISSHSIKRFFNAISLAKVWLFRKILLIIFIGRLKIEKPDIIKLGIDTMVMDNDEASKREGVSPTYKKVKGFEAVTDDLG
jgi:hypothetical protein